MAKFLGVLGFIFLPLLALALVVGRKLEDNEERLERDKEIRTGLKALKRRILTLERLRGVRSTKRG